MYDPTALAFVGEAAQNVQAVASEVLVSYLHARFNDPAAPALLLGGALIPVAVTSEAIIADAIAKGQVLTPVVFVGRGRRRRESWGATLGGVYYDGQRTELTFLIDLATSIAEIDDVTLCDALCDAIEGHEAELWDLGLTEIEIMGDEEAQSAGSGRNPYLITCAVYSLPTYAP